MIDADWLRGLGEPGLTTLLERRPDVLVGPLPGSLTQLADRLTAVGSVFTALRQLDRPTLQVAEAMVALGGTTRHAELYRLMGASSAVATAVDRALNTLPGYGFLTREPALSLIPPARLHWPVPLGLGPPVGGLYERYA